MLFLMERLGLSGSVLQEVQDIPHTPHTTTARSQTGVPPQPNPLQCCDRRATASSSASQGGYSIAGYNINTLAYADDVCVIASSKTEMQSLLDRCAEFGNWSGFRFNAKKCGSMCMVNQAPRIYATWVATSSQPSHGISTWDALLGPSEQGIKTWTL